MHHSRLQPRADTSCAFRLRDDANEEVCWNGNPAAAIDHQGRTAAFIFGARRCGGKQRTNAMYKGDSAKRARFANREIVKLEA